MSQKQSGFHQYIKEQIKARRRQSSSSVPIKKITQPPKSIQTSMSQKQSGFHQYIKEQIKARRRQSSSSVPVKKITQPPKSIQTSEVVQILPPKNLSLKQLRESELQLAKKSIFDKNTSFKQLFVKRMSQLQKRNKLGPSKKTNISEKYQNQCLYIL